MSQADSDSFLKSLLRENPQSFVNPWGDLQTSGKKKQQPGLLGSENTMAEKIYKYGKSQEYHLAEITYSACV